VSFVFFVFWRVPCANASGSGYALQVLTCYASCGLSAAIPHAENKLKVLSSVFDIYYIKSIKYLQFMTLFKSCFFAKITVLFVFKY